MNAYEKLDEATKESWLQALRSGRYTQAKGKLKRLLVGDAVDGSAPVGHCCLGVLAEEAGVLREAATDLWSCDYASTAIVTPVFDLDKGAEVHLFQMNDSGESFDTIADWIEENL